MAPQIYCFIKTRAQLPGIFQLIRQQLYWCHSGTLSIKRQNCVASRLINHVTTASLQGPINITSWILPQKYISILNMFFITWGEAGVLKQRKNRKLKYQHLCHRGLSGATGIAFLQSIPVFTHQPTYQTGEVCPQITPAKRYRGQNRNGSTPETCVRATSDVGSQHSQATKPEKHQL